MGSKSGSLPYFMEYKRIKQLAELINAMKAQGRANNFGGMFSRRATVKYLYPGDLRDRLSHVTHKLMKDTIKEYGYLEYRTYNSYKRKRNRKDRRNQRFLMCEGLCGGILVDELFASKLRTMDALIARVSADRK